MQERDELRALKRDKDVKRKKSKEKMCVWKRERKKEGKRNGKKDMKWMNQVKYK
jgi:hypothetical protein